MKSPRAMRYNDSVESATTSDGLPYLRFGKGEPWVAPNGLYGQRRSEFDRVVAGLLAS